MKRPFFTLAIMLALLILAFRTFIKVEPFYPSHVSNFTTDSPRDVIVKGRIIDAPIYKDRFFYRNQVFTLSPELIKVKKIWYPSYGNMRVTADCGRKYNFGDIILFEGKIRKPSKEGKSGFNYRRYLERLKIYAVASIGAKDMCVFQGNEVSAVSKRAYQAKKKIRAAIDDIFVKPERYFLSAILLGDRLDLPDIWKDIFIKTQTMHLLAISGLHVGIIIFVILFLVGLLGFPRKIKFTLAIAALIFYCVIVGSRPSVVRATIMGVILLSSYIFEKRVDIYNSLGIAAFAILIYNMDQLYDAGFIFSFVSVLSIVYGAPRLNRLMRIDKIDTIGFAGRVGFYVSSLASASLAVWIGLLPMNINFFGLVSGLSILVNIVAIPLVFVIVVLSIAALVINIALPALGYILAEGAMLFIDILIAFIKMISDLPFAYFRIKSLDLKLIICYYVIVIFLVKYVDERRKSQAITKY